MTDRDDLCAILDRIFDEFEPAAVRDEIANAILERWRLVPLCRTEAQRDVNTVITRVNGGRPVAIVADRLCYWTGTEWRWAE